MVRPLLAAALFPALAAPAAQAAGYHADPGPPRASAAFSVQYSGTGHWATTYRSHPPNEGGDDDRNRVRDTSKQRWAFRYPPLTIPDCAADAAACAAVTGPRYAAGRSAASGRIDHTHIDGLYDNMDSAAHCSVRATRLPRTAITAPIAVTYDAASDAFVVAPASPMRDALVLLPPTCPNMGDGLDLILDNYFMPGFSFAMGYGDDRWFTPAPVSIPAATWHSSKEIRIHLGPQPSGTPPRDCAPLNAFERCSTGGRWSGTLTFTARS